jgi:hypothetical protein
MSRRVASGCTGPSWSTSRPSRPSSRCCSSSTTCTAPTADSLALLTRAVAALRPRRALGRRDLPQRRGRRPVGRHPCRARRLRSGAGPAHGLAPEEVAELVRSTAEELLDVDAATLALITERTDGNPFFVQETARLLASEGRLDAAAEVPAGSARRAAAPARAAARRPRRPCCGWRRCIGRDVDVDVLVAAAVASETCSEDDVLDGLDAGLVAGLLTESATGALRFSHVLVRDALYEEVSRLRRVRLHGRVAEAVERVRPAELDALAYHYMAATSPTSPAPAMVAKALHYTLEAARSAKRRFAHAEAVALLERGLALSEPLGAQTAVERVELLIELVSARGYGGNAVGARTARTDAIRLALTVGDDDLIVRAMASWTIPTAWSIRGYAEVDHEMLAWIDAALKRVRDSDSAQRCRLLCCIVAELEGDGEDRTSRAADEALAIARRLGDPELLVAALNARYFVTSPHRDLDERPAIAAELIELATTHDMVEALVLGHLIAAQSAAASATCPRPRTGRARGGTRDDVRAGRWRRSRVPGPGAARTRHR